jgi:hypothetical protein
VANTKTKRVGKYSEPMKRHSVALEVKLYDDCKDDALALGMDMSAYLRMLIIKQRKEGANRVR